MGSTGGRGRLAATSVPNEDRLVVAVEELTQTMGGLGSRLATTEKASNDTAQWRRKATRWQRIAFVSVAAAIVLFWWTDHRDDHRQAQTSLHACQLRNAGQAYTRGIDQGQTDAIAGLGAPVDVTGPLQHAIDVAPPDRDCDGDGVLSQFDYPVQEVTPTTATIPIATEYRP